MSLSGPLRDEREDLEDQRRFLLDSLLDLELQRESGEISKADYEAMRDDYTVRAADILRALRTLDQPPPPPPPPPEAPPQEPLPIKLQPSLARARERPRKAIVFAVIGAMVVIALASVFLLAGARNKGAAAPNPQTPAERLAYAHQLESDGKAVEALKQYDAVLKAEPDNVEALAYRGWLLKLAGLVDLAQTALDRAVAIDPTFADAHFFRGMLFFQDRNDPAQAIPELEAYLASKPPAGTEAAVQSVLDQARQAAANGSTNPNPSPTASPTTSSPNTATPSTLAVR